MQQQRSCCCPQLKKIAITRIKQENILEHDLDSVFSEDDIRQDCKEELHKYKKCVPKVSMKGKFPHAIAWWKKYEKHFPHLDALAHKYLSIQATPALCFEVENFWSSW